MTDLCSSFISSSVRMEIRVMRRSLPLFCHSGTLTVRVLPRQSVEGFARWQSFSSHRNFERALPKRGVSISEMQGRVVWMCRARGFKDHGEYEVVKGFEAQKLGPYHHRHI